MEIKIQVGFNIHLEVLLLHKLIILIQVIIIKLVDQVKKQQNILN